MRSVQSSAHAEKEREREREREWRRVSGLVLVLTEVKLANAKASVVLTTSSIKKLMTQDTHGSLKPR